MVQIFDSDFVGKDPEQTSEIARRSVQEANKMLPILNSYVRAITGKPISIKVSASDNGSTDGKYIYWRPPLALGAKLQHDRRLCDRRDPGDLGQLCPACKVREYVNVTIFHEMGHNIYETFAAITDLDKDQALENAIKEGGSKYAKKLTELMNDSEFMAQKSYLGFAEMISKWLPILVNALEDVRCNREMFEARPGTRKMFEAFANSVFGSGFEAVDPNTGEHTIAHWKTAELNAQSIIAVYCYGSGYKYDDWFDEKVVEALKDKKLRRIMDKLKAVRSSKGTYEIGFQVLNRLRELGFCKLPEDPKTGDEPQPAPPTTGEEEDNQDDGEEDDSGKPQTGSSQPGRGDDSQPDSVPESEEDPSDSGEGRTGEDESDDGSDGRDDSSSDPDSGVSDDGDDGQSDSNDVDPGDSDSHDDDSRFDKSREDSNEAPDPEEQSEIPGESGDSVDETRSEDEPDESSSNDESGDGTPEDEGESDSGDQSDSGGADKSEGSESGGGAGSGEGGSGDTGKVPDNNLSGDQDGTGIPQEPEGSERGDRRQENGDVPNDGPGSDASSDELDGHDYDSESREPDGVESSPLGSGEGSEQDGTSESPEIADQGSQDEEGSKLSPDEVIDSGSHDEDGISVEDQAPNFGEDIDKAIEQLNKWIGHLTDPNNSKAIEAREAMKKSIIQGMYFESPSSNIYGVREHKHQTSVDSKVKGKNNAWDGGAYYEGYSRKNIGVEGDFDAPESVLGPALLQMRTAFEENQRAKYLHHQKKGKINQRVLGKRAPAGDERLFKHKILPGKRNYFVLLGLDVSGSTAGTNIVLEKRAAMAQAELCHRMGIDFAVFAHSGDQSDSNFDNDDWSSWSIDLDIYIVKDAKDPWDEKCKNRLRSLGPDAANLDGHTIEYYRKYIEKQSATDKVIMYYSDGAMPAENHNEELEILQREIEVCKKKNITLMAVGINTDSPRRHGLDTVRVNGDSEIVEVVKHLERRLLR